MNKTNHLNLLSDLIQMANADGKITSAEYDFLKKIAKRLFIPEIEMDKLFISPHPSSIPKNELERITHFYKLVLVMNVDLETHENEVQLLRNFGLKMGIRPTVIDRILIEMVKHENYIIPSETLVQIFKTYYN
ncbi:tellurite resistance TerB family protein [Aequorivita echinoideorum]|uniref:TerB family tellurite resistance protein n=1 Tax=Aequorivita echinoideorum TaxID=1549647 RepID=A0ABS5S7B3_9FLAO|nr:TerB family tellurite resistance protein [Aequorivita echinoideorum]MBT0608310.1 TerB family tellurite resistance protein [Aequorivita echinoideorum]